MIRNFPLGTLVNVMTVIAGSLIGMVLQHAFPENIKAIVFEAIGLCTLLIGVLMALKIPEGYLLHLVFSLIIGGIIGEVLQFDEFLRSLGDNLKAVFQIDESTFTEGMITAFLIFCMGSVTIVGAIEEGIRGNRELLLVKSVLDGVASIALASTYGIGVLFSVIPMIIFQGGITVLAGKVQRIFTKLLIDMLSATGGLLILGLGINILDIGKINIENLLPGLVVVAVAVGMTTYFNREGKSEKVSQKNIF